MGIHVPGILERLLAATADKTNAEARIAGLRQTLTDEAARRYREEGAAPTWKRRDVGTVRYDEPGAWSAIVVDEAAFGSYAAQHYPTETTGVITVPAAELEAALEALRFAGVGVEESRVDVRSNFTASYLEDLVVDVEETPGEDGEVDRTITVVDKGTGQLVPGTSATRSAGKLVVSLERDLKARVIAEAKAAAAADLEAGEAEPVTVDEAIAELAAPPSRRETPDHTVTAIREAAAAQGITLTPAAELTPAERATVDRFEAAPDPFELVEDEDGAPLPPAQQTPEANGHRFPYVGEGADGARRSARIDREEVDGLHALDPRRDELLASAARWEQQARELEGEGPHGNATTASLEEALAMQDPALAEGMVLADGRAVPIPAGGMPRGLGIPKPERETVASVQPARAPEASSTTDVEAEVSAIVALDNREALRRIARNMGVATGGSTKRELAEALHAAGFRA